MGWAKNRKVLEFILENDYLEWIKKFDIKEMGMNLLLMNLQNIAQVNEIDTPTVYYWVIYSLYVKAIYSENLGHTLSTY